MTDFLCIGKLSKETLTAAATAPAAETVAVVIAGRHATVGIACG